jgi:cytochrome c oxidase cbb3-type subunit I/II
MPAYYYLLDNNLDTTNTEAKIRVMMKLGVPYEKGYDKIANNDLRKQANSITANLKKDGIETVSTKEIVALISYLQRLGKDIKSATKEEHNSK